MSAAGGHSLTHTHTVAVCENEGHSPTQHPGWQAPVGADTQQDKQKYDPVHHLLQPAPAWAIQHTAGYCCCCCCHTSRLPSRHNHSRAWQTPQGQDTQHVGDMQECKLLHEGTGCPKDPTSLPACRTRDPAEPAQRKNRDQGHLTQSQTSTCPKTPPPTRAAQARPLLGCLPAVQQTDHTAPLPPESTHDTGTHNLVPPCQAFTGHCAVREHPHAAVRPTPHTQLYGTTGPQRK